MTTDSLTSSDIVNTQQFSEAAENLAAIRDSIGADLAQGQPNPLDSQRTGAEVIRLLETIPGLPPLTGAIRERICQPDSLAYRHGTIRALMHRTDTGSIGVTIYPPGNDQHPSVTIRFQRRVTGGKGVDLKLLFSSDGQIFYGATIMAGEEVEDHPIPSLEKVMILWVDSMGTVTNRSENMNLLSDGIFKINVPGAINAVTTTQGLDNPIDLKALLHQIAVPPAQPAV